MNTKKLSKNISDCLKPFVFPAAVISLVGSLMYFGITDNTPTIRKELARSIAMQYYKPVGNGGALSAFNGHTSLERELRNSLVKETYENRLHLSEMDDLVVEYQQLALKD
ncbi:MAG: hypothetical protein AABW51_04940 [Nanoarchaeota archaeon]